MPSYTDFLRALANILQLKTDIIFVGFPENCDQVYNDIARAKLPTAVFVYPGNCTTDSVVQYTLTGIVNILEEAIKSADKNAFVVFTFANTTTFYNSFNKGLVETMLWLKEENLKPLLITDTPKEFIKRNDLDENDFIAISHKRGSMPAYGQVMDIINDQLLKYKDSGESMKKINTRLGNVINAKPKALLFSSSSQPEFSFATMLSLGIVLYEIYSVFKQCRRHVKYKMG